MEWILQRLCSGADAAKRRTLPAWIRQGLEKMEEDKRKAEQRQAERSAHQAILQKRREREAAALADNPAKSKFVSVAELVAAAGVACRETEPDWWYLLGS